MTYMNAESDALLNGVLRIDDAALERRTENVATGEQSTTTIQDMLQTNPQLVELLSKIF